MHVTVNPAIEMSSFDALDPLEDSCDRPNPVLPNSQSDVSVNGPAPSSADSDLPLSTDNADQIPVFHSDNNPTPTSAKISLLRCIGPDCTF